MKQIYSIIFATLMALFLLLACSEDIYNEYNYDPSLEEGLSFSFTPGDMTFYKSGGDITATIETQKHWVVILRADWLSVSKNSGDGDAELTFTASPLPEGEGNRYSEIEIFISDGRTQRSYRYNVEQVSQEMYADYLNEDFQNGIPDSWHTYNFAYLTKSTQVYSTWEATSILGHSAAKAYNNTSYTIVANDCESWLVTPAIENTNGNLTLSFESFARLTSSDPTSAEFEVYIMNDANPAYSDKILLQPTLATPGNTANSTAEWIQSGKVKLDQMNGTIYIGFRYSPKTPHSTEWYITNVEVEDTNAKKIWLIGGCTGWDVNNPTPEYVLTEEPDAKGSNIFSGTFSISSEEAANGFRFFLKLGDWGTSEQIGSSEANFYEEHISLDENRLYSGPCFWGQGNWVLDNHPGGDLKIIIDLNTMRVYFESVSSR